MKKESFQCAVINERSFGLRNNGTYVNE